MQKWLLSIWQEYKRTILFITHNIDEALYLSDRIIVLSNKPATVQKEFIVPFLRPRKEEILHSTDFLQWKKQIYDEIKKHLVNKHVINHFKVTVSNVLFSVYECAN